MTEARRRKPRETLWRRIHNELRDDIRSGNYGPGDRLPTEAELSVRFGVNRHTVRRALAELRDNDMIHVRRGSGAYVAHSQVGYEIGARTRFTQNVLAIGREPAHSVLRLETIRAGARESETLGLAPGAQIHVVEMLNSADGVPLVYARSIFPADPLPDFADHMRTHPSITASLARAGIIDYVREWTRLTAERPGPMIAQHLKMSETRICLRSESLNVDSHGRPVEYGHSWFCSDRVQIVVDRASFHGNGFGVGDPRSNGETG